MPRFITYIVTFIAVLALISSGTYVLGRWYTIDWLASSSAWILKSSLYFVAFCCAYALAVGVYHTILSVTGLDKEKSGEAESVEAAEP